MSVTDSARMAALAAALNCRTTLDDYRDPVIEGRGRNNIHCDGAGFSIFVTLTSARHWSATKAKLATFCRVTQDGDQEGCLRLPNLPTPDQARLLCRVLGIRQRRPCSPEQAQRLRDLGFKPRTKTGVSGPKNDDHGAGRPDRQNAVSDDKPAAEGPA